MNNNIILSNNISSNIYNISFSNILMGCLFISIIFYFTFIVNKLPSQLTNFFNEANYFFVIFVIILFKKNLNKLNFKILLSVMYFLFL